MTRLLLLLSSVTLALGACASPSDTQTAAAPAEAAQVTRVADPGSDPLPQAVALSGPKDALVLPIAYSCADARTFTATFPADGRSVTVAAAGETRVLRHRGGADAMLYAEEGATLSAEGATATLTGLAGGPYTDCQAG